MRSANILLHSNQKKSTVHCDGGSVVEASSKRDGGEASRAAESADAVERHAALRTLRKKNPTPIWGNHQPRRRTAPAAPTAKTLPVRWNTRLATIVAESAAEEPA